MTRYVTEVKPGRVRRPNPIVQAMGSRMGKRKGASTPWKCRRPNVIFVLQMLSKVSADEVFMHYFENTLSASVGLLPDPQRGSAPGSRCGLLFFRPPYCPPLKKSCGSPWLPRNIICRKVSSNMMN